MLHLGYTSTDSFFSDIETGKILLSALPSVTAASEIEDSLYTVFQDSVFDNIPQCNCKKYKKAYLEGEICEDCGSKVESVLEKKNPLVWFERYPESEKFISPYFWLVFRNLLNTKIDILRYLSDTKYNPPVVMPSWVPQMIRVLEFKRGYNNLVNSLEQILEYVSTHSQFKTGGKGIEAAILLKTFRRDKDNILNNYIGLFNKRLFVVEETKMGHYTNLILGEVKDVAYNYILNNNEHATFDKRQNVMSRLVHGLANITEVYVRENLQGKFGDFRKHLSGARMPFSVRAVIRSMNKASHRDELHIPWAGAVNSLRPHLLNLLVNRMEYSYKEASQLLFEHAKKYNKVIDKCFKIMINESPFGGIVCLFTRNPTLPMGSTHYRIITEIKSDVYDNTISTPNTATKSQNADFDGDALMLYYMLDNVMSRLAKSMQGHHSVPGDKKPGDISAVAGLPSPTVMTLTNYMKLEEPEIYIDERFMDYLYNK